MQRILIPLFTAALLALGSTALAGTSIVLGSTFPGWEKIYSGGLKDDGSSIIRRYATSVAHVCMPPEVFLREGSSSLVTTSVYFDPWLPYDARQEVLLDTNEQKVLFVHTRTGSVLVALLAVDSGLVMLIC